MKTGDTVIAVSGQHVASGDAIEFLCDQDSIGETVPATILRNGQEIPVPIALVQDYANSKIIVESFAALIFFLTGIAVVLLAAER